MSTATRMDETVHDDVPTFSADGGLLASIGSGIPGSRDQFFTPSGLLAGSCPHVPGKEDELVWHAAAEACGSERLHFVWSAHAGRIWYLAAPSSALLRQSGTHCAFAALLPGMARARPDGACYIDVDEGTAHLLSLHPGGIEFYTGDVALIVAKAESLARRMGRGGTSAPIIRLDSLQRLPKVPWRSVSLMEDRLRRLIASTLVLSGLGTALLAGMVWTAALAANTSNQRDLNSLKASTETAVRQLTSVADTLSRSHLTAQLSKFSDIDRSLMQLGGQLRTFEVKGDIVQWSALVPLAISQDQIRSLRAQVTGTDRRFLIIEGTR